MPSNSFSKIFHLFLLFNFTSYNIIPVAAFFLPISPFFLSCCLNFFRFFIFPSYTPSPTSSPLKSFFLSLLISVSFSRGHNLLYFFCPLLAHILLCGYSHVFHSWLSTYPQIVDKLWISHWKSCGFSHLTLKIIPFYARINSEWVYMLLWTGFRLFHNYAHRYTHV